MGRKSWGLRWRGWQVLPSRSFSFFFLFWTCRKALSEWSFSPSRQGVGLGKRKEATGMWGVHLQSLLYHYSSHYLSGIYHVMEGKAKKVRVMEKEGDNTKILHLFE